MFSINAVMKVTMDPPDPPGDDSSLVWSFHLADDRAEMGDVEGRNADIGEGFDEDTWVRVESLEDVISLGDSNGWLGEEEDTSVVVYPDPLGDNSSQASSFHHLADDRAEIGVVEGRNGDNGQGFDEDTGVVEALEHVILGGSNGRSDEEDAASVVVDPDPPGDNSSQASSFQLEDLCEIERDDLTFIDRASSIADVLEGVQTFFQNNSSRLSVGDSNGTLRYGFGNDLYWQILYPALASAIEAMSLNQGAGFIPILPSPSTSLETRVHNENRGRHVRPRGLIYKKRNRNTSERAKNVSTTHVDRSCSMMRCPQCLSSQEPDWIHQEATRQRRMDRDDSDANGFGGMVS